METKWTPGPLFVVRQNDPPNIWIVQDPDTWVHRTAAIPAYADRLGEQEANAQLYAAAPDMADALAPVYEMEMWTESADDNEVVILTVGTVRKMRAALAKARGEA